MTCKVSIQCPECGFIKQITKEFDSFAKTEVMWCDVEEGGCDCKFVLESFAKPVIEVFKIQGQERKVV